MKKNEYFLYHSCLSEIDSSNSCSMYVDDIKNKTEILSLYYQSFKFPDYFGFTWDALTDSLCYLDAWLLEKKIIVIHKKLPQLGEKDFKIYISVLYDVCEFWAKHPDVLEFKVYFPIEYKSIIQGILRNINSRFG